MNGRIESPIFNQTNMPSSYLMARAGSNDVANNEMMLMNRVPAADMNSMLMNANRPVSSPSVSPSLLSMDSSDDTSVSSFNTELTSMSEPGLVNKKRGRRPLSESSHQSADGSSQSQSGGYQGKSTSSSEQESKLQRMKQAAKEQLKVQDESQLARFGNKYVIKGSEEYYILKKKNNEAVKRCRKNNAINQKHIDKKIKDLDDENKKLEIEVDSLELCVKKLKSNIIQNKNFERLPDSIRSILLSL